MYFTAICLFAVIPFISAQGPPQEYIRNFCPDGNERCVAAVRRCLGDPAAQQQQQAAPNNVQNVAQKYAQCFKDKGVQVLSVSNSGDQQFDIQNNIQATLAGITDSVILNDLRCCFGKSVGVLDANNHIDLANYKTDIEKNYRNDAGAISAYLKATSSCQTNVANCEAGIFTECTFQQCIRSLTAATQ